MFKLKANKAPLIGDRKVNLPWEFFRLDIEEGGVSEKQKIITNGIRSLHQPAWILIIVKME